MTITANYLKQINSITATVVACINCGMEGSRIEAKLIAKYGMSKCQAEYLVYAIEQLA